MRCRRLLFQGIVALTVGAILAPSASMAAQPVNVSLAPVARDVALAPGGVLRGQVASSAGVPLAGSSVVLKQTGQPVATCSTDAQGVFVITGVPGGSYELSAAQSTRPYRLWAPDTAPPTAARNLLVVSEAPMARGQIPALGLAGGAEVAGAIAGVAAMGAGVFVIMQDDSGS